MNFCEEFHMLVEREISNFSRNTFFFLKLTVNFSLKCSKHTEQQLVVKFRVISFPNCFEIVLPLEWLIYTRMYRQSQTHFGDTLEFLCSHWPEYSRNQRNPIKVFRMRRERERERGFFQLRHEIAQGKERLSPFSGYLSIEMKQTRHDFSSLLFSSIFRWQSYQTARSKTVSWQLSRRMTFESSRI